MKPGEVEYIVPVKFLIVARSAEEAVNTVRDALTVADNGHDLGPASERWIVGPPQRLTPRPYRAPRQTSKRPFRLYFSNTGVALDLWGSYGSAKAAWSRVNEHTRSIRKNRHMYLYNGWWVVTGPDNYYGYRGVGTCSGRIPVVNPRWAVVVPLGAEPS